MKITTRSRYGTRLIVELALRWGEAPVRLGGIAREGDLPVKYLEQLIIHLKRSGLISSTRGPSGGYCLSRSPETITVWDIVKVLEKEERVAPCVNDPLACNRSGVCPTRDVWSKVAQAVEEQLTSITLADLVGEEPEDSSKGERGCIRKK